MKKILIVEDDKKIAKAMGIRLRANGYEVEIAHDSVVASTTARNYQPDLILLDIQLPGGDGFTLAERFQNISSTAGVPIIFVTASKKPGLKQKAMDLGAVSFFEKPFNSTQLLDTVAAAI